MQNQPPQNQIKIDPRTLPDVVCDACGHNRFQIEFLIKKVSPFLSGRPKEERIPIDVFVCAKCGHLNDSLNPLKQIIPATNAEVDSILETPGK
jgi:DNA-directed RNA polymerase subunit RPC12/RpoP